MEELNEHRNGDFQPIGIEREYYYGSLIEKRYILMTFQ
jgi:hypothetical protein